MKYFNPIAALLIVSVLFSCNRSTNLENIKEGTITYKITYLGESIPQPGLDFLPDEMELTFNEHYSRTSIEGFMGVFTLGLITDLKNRKTSTFVKVFEKKYMYTGQTGKYSCLFDFMNPLLVKECDELKNIAGYVTKCTDVSESDDSSSQFRIFYTQDIVVKNPNVNSPYENINGVMLQFQMKFDKITMIFTAEKVSRKNIPNKEFQFPDGYIQTTEEKMKKILTQLMEI